MSKRQLRLDVDPETGELVEIDVELDAALGEAIARMDRGEGIPLEVILKEWEDEAHSQSR